MINIEDKKNCTGCAACKRICPKNCIEMVNDPCGFAYPSVDNEACVKCGRCVEVCPIINPADTGSPIEVWGTKNKDEAVRSTSSSGGTFFELAKSVISRGGVVFGCALDSELVARHIGVDAIEGLSALKGSKYVQSDVGTTYTEVKALLAEGREVLYSGTPCQIAGLKKYLGKRYDGLLLVDVLCHGVPSPEVFKDYLGYLADKYKSKPVSVNFRNKEKSWKRLYFEVIFENGKRYFTFCGYDRYMSMFLNNISLRPSCYDCRFTSVNRQGDITLGDFWGIGKKHPERDDDKGISLVIVNSAKGSAAYREISDRFDVFDSDIEAAKNPQHTMTAPALKSPKRDEFYSLYSERGITCAVESVTSVPSAPKKLYYAAKDLCVSLAKKILGR